MKSKILCLTLLCSFVSLMVISCGSDVDHLTTSTIPKASVSQPAMSDFSQFTLMAGGKPEYEDAYYNGTTVKDERN